MPTMTRVMQHLSTGSVIAASTIGFITVLGICWYQNRKRNAVPTVWHPIGKVHGLYIYPLKSGRRTEVETAMCTEYGLQMPKSGADFQLCDRNLVIFKEDNKKTYSHPKILLIKTTACGKEHFILKAPNMPELKVKIPIFLKCSKTDQISALKNEQLLTLDCGSEAAKWLSTYLLEEDCGLRLGFHNGSYKRNINEAYKKYLKIYPKLRNETTGMYSNLTSYLVVNQASVEDLNKRLTEANVTAHNFRPNILVEGSTPYAEDDWRWIKIGDVVLYSAKLCTRCDSTTINPETAVKSERHEPLKTLRKYRQLKDLTNIELDGYRAVMGNNMGLHKEGHISIGDVVYVGKS